MKSLLVAALALVVLQSSAVESLSAASHPNIVFIFVDDMGYGDLSCFRELGATRGHATGDAHYPATPRIDALAEQGVRLTNFYVASPICSPSRVGCTTGQYPARHLINSYLNNRARNRARGMADFLNPQVPAIARAFQSHGYATAHFGKWHQGGGRDVHDAPLPQAYGFDESLVSFEGLGDRILPPGGLSKQSETLEQGEITWVEKHEQTGIYIDRCLDFIDRHRDKPFYLHLWLNDVHDGHNPAPGEAEKFAKLTDNPNEQRFFAVLVEMDRQIGRLIEKVDTLGLSGQTLIVLTSDNGPTAWPRYYRDGDDPAGSTAGFRGRKWSLYEGGIRMPFIARWPGKITANTVNDQLILSAVDFFPTFCSLAQIDVAKILESHKLTTGGAPPTLAPAEYFDGEDLSDELLSGIGQRTRPLFWEYGRTETYLRPGLPIDQSPNLAIRDGRWKLLMNDDGSRIELYDLDSSRTEFENVAGRHPDPAQRLSTQLLAWRKSLPALASESEIPQNVGNQTVYRFSAGTSLPTEKSPPIASAAFEVSAEITPNGGDGVIVAQGGSAAGYALYVQDDTLKFTTRVRSQETTLAGAQLERGKRIRITAACAGDGRLTLNVDGQHVASGKAPNTIPNRPGDGIDVGRDVKSPVGMYQSPFAWSGTVHAAAVAVEKPQSTSGHLVTRFAADVDPEHPLPEYPRPQMVRENWLNLNGQWQYAIRPKNQTEPPEKWDGRIVVPFCPESILSGVQKRVGEENRLWYRRTFMLPNGWHARTLLHFGAVDWQTQVWINGRRINQNGGIHEGGYDPFSYELTSLLKPSGENEIVVGVWDPTDNAPQPRGKQVNEPRGIWYTPVTGIWQTVWLEPVPLGYIGRIDVTPDVDNSSVRLLVNRHGGTLRESADRYQGQITATLNAGDAVVASAEGTTGTEFEITIDDPHLWSPEDPFLYDLVITLKRPTGTVEDQVRSYVGLRKIELGRGPNGFKRLLLNGEYLFQYGPLDQGWWPDGLYTAPTDEALRYDIEVTKQLGFNMARKHVKVEPQRWYYWCDKLGLLVWQDMPSAFTTGRSEERIGRGADQDATFPPAGKKIFRKELQALVDSHRNHPCIVAWCPINEGWGQHDTNEILKWVKEYDPTRLVNGPSGWEDRGYGDMKDMHKYPGPAMFPAMPDRASVLGEFGGLGLPLLGHTWVTQNNWGYRNYQTQEELLQAYSTLLSQMPGLIADGLAAAIYTQTTDVEIEVNGLLTYDRQVIKFDPETLRELHAPLYEPPKRRITFLKTSEQSPQLWSYTTTQPAAGWTRVDFDDHAWARGPGGFGTTSTPGARIGTEWNTSDIWLRRVFELTSPPDSPLSLRIHHDEDVEVYLNGVQISEQAGYTSDYGTHPIPNAGDHPFRLRVGRNVLSIHCHQTDGGQYVDAGLETFVDPNGL